ncbi:hypothetical protein [Myxococcus sp. CA040A]|uniref:hypothetical protein n=1 Tax=Myxococcus sp. CA040A TaxID=2741738 RepID=UPI00157AC9F7|nr:hypothetical protein [Myxococcus sp. CA040A]NTX05659.1 hypothetical protein [Myxococcus sp. CA040A]
MAQLNIEGKVIENERIVLGREDIAFLGPNLTLRACTVTVKVTARNLILIQPRLIDCVIEVKQELKNLRWCKAFLKGCRFTGVMSGNDFGRWPFDEEAEKKLGGIEDCDFSGARLDACRFLDCDVDTLKLPSWPCFTFLDPTRRRQELLAAPWPGTSRIVVESLVEAPPETVAATYSAPAVARYSDTTEEALLAVLQTLDGVRL